jgi:large conductance mechanosensitive channel
MIKGFKEFLLKNNVLALAVAVIVGGAVGKVVSSLAADILMPLLSPLIGGGGEWRSAKLVLGKSVGADSKEVINAISYGNFLGNVVDFVIIAFVVYMITKALIKEPPAAPPAPSKNCPRCKEAIAVDATKCKFCTADI